MFNIRLSIMEDMRRSAYAHLLGWGSQGRQSKWGRFSELIYETALDSHVQRAIQTLTGSPLGPGDPASPFIPLIPAGP